MKTCLSLTLSLCCCLMACDDPKDPPSETGGMSVGGSSLDGGVGGDSTGGGEAGMSSTGGGEAGMSSTGGGEAGSGEAGIDQNADLGVDDAMLPDVGVMDALIVDPPDGGDLPPSIIANRTPIWVCNAQYGQDLEPESNALLLNSIQNGSGSLRIAPTSIPCVFDPLYIDGGAPEISLGESGTYLLGAGVQADELLAVCLTRVEHESAEIEGETDVENVMLRRSTTGIAALCAIRDSSGWTPLVEVIPSTLEFGAWVMEVSAQPNGAFILTYQRDTSLNPLNITPYGRPEEDGVYTVNFELDGDTLRALNTPQKISDLAAVDLSSPPDPCAEEGADVNDPQCQPRCGDQKCDSLEQCGDMEGAEAPACIQDCGPCTLTLDDADDPGYRELEGEWLTSRGHEGYARFSESGRASFDFTGLKNGWKSFSVQHPRNPLSSTSATYIILSNGREIGRVSDDQRRSEDGWVTLGDFFVEGDFSIQVLNTGEGRLRADAIKVDISSAPPMVLEDNSPTYRELEGVWETRESGSGGTHRWSPNGHAQYTLNASTGAYQVGIYLPPPTQESGLAEYRLSVGDVAQATLVLDQGRGADAWVDLGVYTLAGASVSLNIQSLDEGGVAVDAVRFTPLTDPQPTDEISVDIENPFYREAGVWMTAEGGRQSADPASTAIYTFSGLSPQAYHIVTQHPTGDGYVSDAEYILSAEGGLIHRVVVDQNQPFVGEWHKIGEVFAPGPEMLIHLGRQLDSGLLHAGPIKLISFECETCEGAP